MLGHSPFLVFGSRNNAPLPPHSCSMLKVQLKMSPNSTLNGEGGRRGEGGGKGGRRWGKGGGRGGRGGGKGGGC